MRFRGKSIRRKIVALLLVPLVSLTGLWVFATVVTGREAGELMGASTVVRKVGIPMEEAVRAVQAERRQTLVFLADPRASDALPELRIRRAATDREVADVRASARQKDIRASLGSEAETQLDSVLGEIDGLAALRQSVEKRTIDRPHAMAFYNGLIDPGYRFLNGLRTMDNVTMDRQVRALVGISRARELLSREDALIASGLTAGRLGAPDLRKISDLVAGRDLLYDVNLDLLPGPERRHMEQYWRGAATEPLRTAENALIEDGPFKKPGEIDSERWQEAAPPVLDRLADDSIELAHRFQDRAEPVGYRVLLQAGIAGVLGFLALLVSVFVSVRIGRELIRDLSRLRKDAHEVSGVRLPSVMRRLAAGERVDVETEAPHLQYERDEIGQVGQALNTLQRAAVEAAVKQADMRRGVSEVFVNLARRNQVLLHRQLTLLDTMERRTENSDELADLFRLDHLTTRMRRHAEGLVILSGAAPSRQWRKPIQLMDVVRAAVAEVEDYERIEVRRLPRIGVGGPAVADLTHLIAELLENATVFSPPHTAVQVHGERVANGFTLEIHDRGLGMTPEVLLDANLRLAETPDFELSDTDRLGLFVVSRLAQRQNVRVSLQMSPYGGTTAVVFIPAPLLTDGPDAPDTHGTGFRLDRRSTGTGDHAQSALSPVPTGLGDPPLLDGPVELEGPVGALDFTGDPALDRALDPALAPVLDGVRDLEDTESERGGIFRARDRQARETRDQHQQPRGRSDDRPGDVSPMRPARHVPLPRRKPPTLITDRGRRVDEPVPFPAQRGPGSRPTQAAPSTGREKVGGLPRRVRQASLASQLREGSAARTSGRIPADTFDDLERDADEVRDRMASLQRGWQRGRRQNAEDPTGPGDTAPGTTTGGDGR
ncbi:MAG TPA: nitrate- and nitrite sensing domain-containing protein [Streptomyces sp.]